jgi:hypothetical protein
VRRPVQSQRLFERLRRQALRMAGDLLEVPRNEVLKHQEEEGGYGKGSDAVAEQNDPDAVEQPPVDSLQVDNDPQLAEGKLPAILGMDQWEAVSAAPALGVFLPGVVDDITIVHDLGALNVRDAGDAVQNQLDLPSVERPEAAGQTLELAEAEVLDRIGHHVQVAPVLAVELQ